MILIEFFLISVIINIIFWYREYGRNRKYPIILLFHQIENNWRPGVGWNYLRQFSRFMTYLKDNNYNVLPLSILLDNTKRYSRKEIIITFDDGYEDVYKYVYPIMKKYDFPFAIFPIVDYFGKYNDWDFVIGEKTRHLDIEQLIELSNDEFVTIGSHTLNHLDLNRVSKQIMRSEIVNSKEKLEKIIGRDVDYLSYPFGIYNDTVIKITKDSGYKMALGYYARKNSDSYYTIPRTGIYLIDTMLDFKLKLKNYFIIFGWLEDLKGRTINLLSNLACNNKRKNEIY